MWKTVAEIINKQSLEKEVKKLRNDLNQNFDLKKYIIGESKAIKNTFQLIKKAALSNINVLLEGETGTGKDLTANHSPQ